MFILIVDRTGDRFGTLLVLRKTDQKKGTTYLYDCLCENCGSVKQFTSNALKKLKSCGCLRNKGTPKDITGQRKGNLVAIESTGNKSNNKDYIWLFQCDCGNTCERTIGAFNHSQRHQSCGCALSELRRSREDFHGKKDSPEYTNWRKMKERCYNTEDPLYPDYGGKGILMCDSWYNSFSEFYEDMGQKPDIRCTVDRIDPLKGYFPENCRWALPSVQSRNRRSFTGSSKYKGVCFDPEENKWVAQFRVGGNSSKKIGRYKNEDHAAAAYNLATKLIFGENCDYTILNDTPCGDEVVNLNCKFFQYWVPKLIEEKEKLYKVFE